ncbi:MAG TPA: gliding motility lipoprotein GldD [Flavobacteriales bacterium]|nr:gliding motility lipoprotein GldD [Flavobacteriales bacterium]|tara:strand:- start:152186 stop:152791 length:606 start_codon:yes stop_codon:yes gene_type:complete
MKISVFKKKLPAWAILFAFLILQSCEDGEYQPRPKGYFRIDFPQKNYRQYQGDCPFSFSYPTYTHIVNNPNGYCWMNIVFPKFKATVYLSYSPVQNNIDTLLEDSHTLVYKHAVKAADIQLNTIIDTSKHTYITTYDIYGDAASEFQFQITDSTRHFLRGSLYFNTAPNRDSLQPVINFIKQDIDVMLKSFEWKTQDDNPD